MLIAIVTSTDLSVGESPLSLGPLARILVETRQPGKGSRNPAFLGRSPANAEHCLRGRERVRSIARVRCCLSRCSTHFGNHLFGLLAIQTEAFNKRAH